MANLNPPTLSAEDRLLVAIATGRLELLPADLPDVAAVCGRIRQHRLEGRCLRHATKIGALPYGPALLRLVEAASAETKAAFDRNSKELTRLAAGFGSGLGVMIKGFSTHLILGDPAALRCGDIDLIVPDGAPLIRTLLDTGFIQTRQAFLHEIGEFTRDGVEFDLQWGFPVPQQPQMLDPGTLLQVVSVSESIHIDAQLAMEMSQLIQLHGIDVRVPRPELAAVIAASHAFMNYANIWSISHREKTWVCLAELADVSELAAHPTFSMATFRKLVEQLRAHAVIGWLDEIWLQLSGKSVFGDLFAPARKTHCCLWWDTWISIEPPVRLLLRQFWYPMDEVFARLRQFADGTLDTPTERAAVAWAADGMPTATVQLSSEGLKLMLQGQRADEATLLRMRIDTGLHAEEIAIKSSPPPGIELSKVGDTVTARISQRKLRSVFSSRSIGIVGLLAEREGEMFAIMVVPLDLGAP